MTDVHRAAQRLAVAVAQLRQAERAAELGHRHLDDVLRRAQVRG